MSVLRPLSPGARVAVVGTSGPPTRKMQRRALELLSSWGFEAIAYASSRAEHPRASYLTGPDSLRARDVEDAWCDPDVDGVVAIRGGYGSVRMLDLLDTARMRAVPPKPFFGSSDTTALQEWLREVLGAPSWFTPMPGVGSHLHDQVAMEGLREVMCEPWAGRRIADEDAEVLVSGSAAGTTIGGNLSLLQMTLGARSRGPLDNTDTIALLEDVNEETYKIDGFLTSLLRAGWFEGVRGIALGSWLGCVDDEVRDLCVELLAPLGVPMVWGVGFGHGLGAASVPLGVLARVEAEGEPGLVLGG